MKNKILVFFIIGFVLYLIDIGLNNYDDKEIFISDSEITSLITAWRSQVGRNPNDDEVARIINDLVQEEILYREALKLGLDQDDRIIKRRLAQKLSFLKQESVEKLPSSQELKDFFNDNKEKYYIEPEYTFTHYFFSSESNSFDRSNKAIKDIYGNKQINADPFLLGKNFVDVNLNKIKNDFGESFSQSIKNMELNKWVGPIKSPYGHHIVFISNYKNGYFPEISMVLKQVEIDLLQLRRDSAIQEYLEEIQSEYKIYINPELTF